METKFTPGPWMWDSDPVKGDPLGRIRYQVVARGKTITKVYYSSFEGGLTNAEADARLIAAAPELFEALTRTFDMLDTSLLRDTFGGEWVNEARAAIAKATGAA